MQYTPQHTIGEVLCCMCATPTPPNPSNMCVNCIRSQVDITENIPKQIHIHWCKNCERYLQPPAHWVKADLESRELLTFCIKRVKGLPKLKLVDAGFVWTEPHSKRLKVKLTVQAEVMNGTILQQVFIVEYIVNNEMCNDCHKVEAKNLWTAVAQLRQKADHKRTFYWLEQLMLKHNAHANTISIKEYSDGLDFFFANTSHAKKMLEFLSGVIPMRFIEAKQLISQDTQSGTATYKFTYSVQIAAVCRDDLVCLPAKVARSLGNISQLVLCTKLSSTLHFVDPFTLQVVELQSSNYWKEPFESLCNAKALVEYTVLDVTPLGPTNKKLVLAEVELARTSDFGRNDRKVVTRTHLGHLLQPGDYCLAYDVGCANFNDVNLNILGNRELPEIVVVRKTYPHRRRRNQRRIWKLKTLPKEENENSRKSDIAKAESDYETFLQELEEDPELRSGVNLYRDPTAPLRRPKASDAMKDEDEDDMADEEDSQADDDLPDVELNELLDDLSISDR